MSSQRSGAKSERSVGGWLLSTALQVHHTAIAHVILKPVAIELCYL